MYTNGVSLKQISSHVKRTLGIDVSKDTIHRLLKPRRKGTNASKLFKSLVDARVPPKRNSGEKKIHPDFQYTCSQVNLINEMATFCNDGTICLSVDNKNKIEVGNPATSRRAQIRSFYLDNEAPNYNDHDFPHRNSKLTPAGYQILRKKHNRSRSCSPIRNVRRYKCKRSLSLDSDGVDDVRKACEITKDKLGRKKIAWPRSGPLTIQLYPSRVIESTNVMHANFLLNFLQREKVNREIFNVIAIADGGPDWSVKGIINLMSLGYLWKNSSLDVLILQCYAPGHSRFNPIERSWSQLTKWLVGVILPVDIDGEVPKENDDAKWNQVLDRAAVLCSKFWHGKFYAGFRLTVNTFLSDNRLVGQLKSTHKLLHTFANASAKKIKENTDMLELQSMYQFFVRHCNRKAYQIEFVRCKGISCTHCSNLPVRQNRLLDMIDEFGGSCPSPEKNNFYPGHYNTFLEMLQTQHCKSSSSKITRSRPRLQQSRMLINLGPQFILESIAIN